MNCFQSYLVGRKRGTSKHARGTTLTFSLCTYLPWHWALFQVYLFSKWYVTFFVQWIFSYLVGLKTRTSRRVAGKKDNSHFFCYVLISPDLGRHPRFTFWLIYFQRDMLPLFFSGLLSYLVGMKRRTSRHVACKRDNSHFLCFVLVSPGAKILCRP